MTKWLNFNEIIKTGYDKIPYGILEYSKIDLFPFDPVKWHTTTFHTYTEI